jgi:hypothetical protein
MTEWASLHDAYGSAEHVPALLASAAAAGTDGGGLWDELWGRLCHQGTVYSASYAALPTLAQMSAQRGPGGYVPALHLAAAIIASNDGPEEDTAVVRQRYAYELADLRTVAARNLRYATDDTEFVYGLQALMAFEDGGIWQRTLHCLANGEASLECPLCGEDLVLNLDSPKPHVASFAGASLAPAAVTPREPSALTDEGRLLALAQTNHRTVIAAKLPFLFGGSTCPHCDASFEVPQAFA